MDIVEEYTTFWNHPIVIGLSREQFGAIFLELNRELNSELSDWIHYKWGGQSATKFTYDYRERMAFVYETYFTFVQGEGRGCMLIVVNNPQLEETYLVYTNG